MYVRLPPEDWIAPIVRPDLSDPPTHPSEGIGVSSGGCVASTPPSSDMPSDVVPPVPGDIEPESLDVPPVPDDIEPESLDVPPVLDDIEPESFDVPPAPPGFIVVCVPAVGADVVETAAASPDIAAGAIVPAESDALLPDVSSVAPLSPHAEHTKAIPSAMPSREISIPLRRPHGEQEAPLPPAERATNNHMLHMPTSPRTNQLKLFTTNRVQALKVSADPTML